MLDNFLIIVGGQTAQAVDGVRMLIGPPDKILYAAEVTGYSERSAYGKVYMEWFVIGERWRGGSQLIKFCLDGGDPMILHRIGHFQVPDIFHCFHWISGYSWCLLELT